MGDANRDEQRKNAGERMGEFCGARAVASYGDTAAEFQALRTGCGVASRTWRKRLKIGGADRGRWLNGMVTNNIRDLAPGHGLYAFFLSPQGRIQADMYCFHREQDFIVETDAWQMEGLRSAFDKYIIMDDVELADAEAQPGLLVAGPKAAETLHRVLGDGTGSCVDRLAPLEFGQAAVDRSLITAIRGDDSFIPSFELWGGSNDSPGLWAKLVAAGAKPIGFEALEMLRIWSGRPRFGQDIRERDLPQETEQHQALDFSKGCYVGQEIVERIRSRGNVHRTFHGFVLSGETPVRGAKLQADGKEVGELTSVNRIPAAREERPVALGYIRREALERGAKITYPGGEAQPAKVPFSIAS
jgi:aminomethyltransferase